MVKRRKYSKGKRTTSRFTLTNVVDTVVRRTTELKHFNVVKGWNFVASPYDYMALSQVPTGSTSVTKVADQLTAATLSIRYVLYNDEVTALTKPDINTVRFLVVQWYPLATSIPLITDVLESTQYNSDYRLSNRQMYKILADVTKTCVPINDSAMHGGSLRIKIPRRSAKLNFTSGTVQSTNSLYLFCIAYNSGATCRTLIDVSSWLYFYDS